MKQFLILTAFAFFNINANAQSNNEVAFIQQLKVAINKGQLFMSWQSANANNEAAFEIQASEDGVKFSTIGYVLGADPKGVRGGYAFKQQTNKMKPGMHYFRVLQQVTANTAMTSEAIGISK
jgi:hypothetical protein